MLTHHWPLFALRITTPRLELRYPDDELLAALATLAASGIHGDDEMPFLVPWTRGADVERRALQHHWRRRAELGPDEWHLPFAVFEGATLVGLQELFAVGFGETRTVESGSWLGRAHQGRGIGAEMRAAVLHLAFAELGAGTAMTGAWHDNPASIAVSRKLGYLDGGDELRDREGRTERLLRFRLDRAQWTQRDDIASTGVEEVLPLLGIRRLERPADGRSD